MDSIIRDVGHKVSRAQIEQVASEVAAQFEDARITAYIPIIMDRMIRMRLQEGPGRTVIPRAASALPAPGLRAQCRSR